MKKMFGFLLAASCLLVACDKKDSSGSRQVTIRLTDNPYDAEEVNVDIRSVQIKAEDNDNDNDGWYTLDTDGRIYNLLDLQNDVNVVLANGSYPPDRIREIRLVLGDNNSIKIGSNIYPLTVPSGSSSGVKLKINKALSEGDNQLIIDFDAALSVHQTGNGMYMLRPVIKLK